MFHFLVLLQVLFEIFKFLCSRDRNKAKLVCKQWLQICRCKRFVGARVICIPYFYNFSQIKEIIDVFPDEQLNLKFTNRRFFPRIRKLEFWKENGHKIQSLQFYKCDFRYAVLPQILRHCTNLTELSLIDCDRRYKPVINDLGPVLQFRSNAKVNHENLIKLELNQNSEYLSLEEDEFKFIASAFPNLKSLKILLQHSVADKDFSVLLNLLETRFEHVDTVHVNFPPFTDNFPVNLSTMHRLVSLNRWVHLSVFLKLFCRPVFFFFWMLGNTNEETKSWNFKWKFMCLLIFPLSIEKKRYLVLSEFN